MLQERSRRHEEAETVSYSGPCLAELLAASGESQVLTADELESIESIESTVVIAGGHPISLPLLAAPQRCASSIHPVAYTLSPPVVAEAPRRGLGRPMAASLMAGIGLLFGLFMGTAFSTEAPRPARALASQVQPGVVIAQTTPLVSPTHQKVATKKKGRVAGNVTHPAVHSPATAAPARALANDATDDSQRVEDLRLVLAAEAERPL